MTLPLPNLDDRTFADLVEEARTLIRTRQPDWTNHNPSEPGIALIELFSWLAEMLIYRANQVPDRHRIAFLELLNEPGWEHKNGVPIDDEIASTLNALRSRYRAVTVEDYEALALEASADVARARCIPGRDLSLGDEALRAEPRPGYVSVIVLREADANADGTDDATAEALRGEVHKHLEPRRLLTIQNVVAAPVWSRVAPLVLVAPREDVPDLVAVGRVKEALKAFLHPVRGGRDATGWPWGRDVYVSELYRVLEALPEIDYVPDITLSSAHKGEARFAPATVLWNAQGDQIGLQIAPHVLPWLQLDESSVFASKAFVSIRAEMDVTPEPGALPDAVSYFVKEELRKVFDPKKIRDTLATWGKWSTTPSEVQNSLAQVPGATIDAVVLRGDPQHVTTTTQGDAEVTLTAGELVDLQVQVNVT